MLRTIALLAALTGSTLAFAPDGPEPKAPDRVPTAKEQREAERKADEADDRAYALERKAEREAKRKAREEKRAVELAAALERLPDEETFRRWKRAKLYRGALRATNRAFLGSDSSRTAFFRWRIRPDNEHVAVKFTDADLQVIHDRFLILWDRRRNQVDGEGPQDPYTNHIELHLNKDAEVTADGLRALAPLHVTMLSLRGVKTLNDDDLASLFGWKRIGGLSVLSVRNCPNITGSFLLGFSKRARDQLVHLDLEGMPVTDNMIKPFMRGGGRERCAI